MVLSQILQEEVTPQDEEPLNQEHGQNNFVDEGSSAVPMEDVDGLSGPGENVRVVWNVSQGNIVYVTRNKHPTININLPPNEE